MFKITFEKIFFGVSKDLSHYKYLVFFLIFQASSYIHFILLIVRGSVFRIFFTKVCTCFAYLFYVARFVRINLVFQS